MGNRRSDDPIIYFTLIDFLLQLVFSAIFIFAITAVKSDTAGKLPAWVFDRQYLPLIHELDGTLSPFIRAKEAKELRALLEEISKQGLLEDLLKILQNNAKPLELLRECSKSGANCQRLIARCATNPRSCEALADMSDEKFAGIAGGAGKPFCLKGDFKRALFLVRGIETVARGKFLRISNITPVGQLTLDEVRLPIKEGLEFSPEEFRRKFSIFEGSKCVHVVAYRAESDSLKLVQALSAFSVAYVNE